jgi:outer membrane biogenesis lipoprotein LolB
MTRAKYLLFSVAALVAAILTACGGEPKRF